jgi:superoxide dismutase
MRNVVLMRAPSRADHTFFWEGMKANGGGEPGGKLSDAIDRDFGSYGEFAKQFKAAGATQFGSGWAWLVTDAKGKLSVTKTPNAETPITTGEVRARTRTWLALDESISCAALWCHRISAVAALQGGPAPHSLQACTLHACGLCAVSRTVHVS